MPTPAACHSESTLPIGTEGHAGAPAGAAPTQAAGAPHEGGGGGGGGGDAGAAGMPGSGGTPETPAEVACEETLNPRFRLQFEELALDDEPQELTDLEFVPDARSQLLLLDKQGRLRWYELGEDGGALLGALQVPDVYGEDDCGAVSLSFDPAYGDNHFVYVGHCLTATSSRITRLALSEDFADAAATGRQHHRRRRPARDAPVAQRGFDRLR